MPTAIVGAYTPEGFVLAADGRSTGPNHVVVSDTVQKIFQIKGPDTELAFALMGQAEIVADSGDKDVFSMVAALGQSALSLNPLRSRNLVGFTTRLCRPVNQTLGDLKKRGRIDFYPDDGRSTAELRGCTISTVFVEGYFRGDPEQAVARFFHEKQVLREPEVSSHPCVQEYVWGSNEVSRLINETQDPRFARYRVPYSGGEPPLQLAIEIAKNYIQAHSDPAALDVDEKICHAIGGRIHIATITPADGFRWVSGFDPASERVST